VGQNTGVFFKIMRKVVAISMPDEMHENLVRRLSRTKYASVSEYIRDLIRKDEAGHGAQASSENDDYDLSGIFTVRPANDFVGSS
jgi:Arc/MetJ-type ribon-helix-helix transcriptional regulator